MIADGRCLALISLAVAIACAPGPRPAAPSAPSVVARPAWGTFGVDFAGMDRDIRPGDDFWSYVNGGWARRVTIPADRGTEGQVSRLNDLAASQVRAILEEMTSRRTALVGDDRRIADYYAALMDRAAIDARGMAPLLEELAPARAAIDRRALAGVMGRLVRHWVATPPIARMPRYLPSPFALGDRAGSPVPRPVCRPRPSGWARDAEP